MSNSQLYSHFAPRKAGFSIFAWFDNSDRIFLVARLAVKDGQPQMIKPVIQTSIGDVELIGKIIACFGLSGYADNAPADTLLSQSELSQTVGVKNWKQLEQTFSKVVIATSGSSAVLDLYPCTALTHNDLAKQILCSSDKEQIAELFKETVSDLTAKLRHQGVDERVSLRKARRVKAKHFTQDQLNSFRDTPGQVVFHPLDSEELSESGLRGAYGEVYPDLLQFLDNPLTVEEVFDKSKQFLVKCRSGLVDVLATSEQDSEVQADEWFAAQRLLFILINSQLQKSPFRFFCIAGGNDLLGVFLPKDFCEHDAMIDGCRPYLIDG